MGLRTPLTVLALAIAALTSPAIAGAATMTATNDSGQPVALAEGSPLTMRHMAPVITPSFSPSEKLYTLRITGPDGKVATGGRVCGATSGTGPETISYVGNGTYAIQLITYTSEDDFYCEGPSTTQNFSLVINASVTVNGPKSPLLFRTAGGSIIEHLFTFDRNPGATGFSFTWAWDAKLGPGNAILGEYDKSNFGQRDLSVTDGTLKLGFAHSGLLTLVAAANTFTGSSPNSAPVVLKLMGPFDWGSTPRFSGGRAPTYKIGGQILEPRIVGQKVSVLIAKGAGKFKPFKTITIPATRELNYTYKQRKLGKYRVKYVFKGSEYVAAGAWIQKLTLKKRSANISPPVPAAL